MRMVFDDERFDEASELIMSAVNQIRPSDVSEPSYGMNRARASKIKYEVLRIINSHGVKFRFGDTKHAHGIGNNNATQIVALGGSGEAQICGYFHTNEDMFSGCYCYVTDIFGERKSATRLINGSR